MEYKVSWADLGGRIAVVDAEGRWEAVSKAAVALGIDKAFPMSTLFSTASVVRPGREGLGRRKVLDKEDKASRLEEAKSKLRGEMSEIAVGECPICGLSRSLVIYRWVSKGDTYRKDICGVCYSKLKSPRTLEVLLDSSPFEVQSFYVKLLDGLEKSFLECDFGLKESFLSFLKRKSKSLNIDVSPWLKSSQKEVSKNEVSSES